MQAINRRGKTRGSVTYSSDQEDDYISVVCLTGSRTISLLEEGLQIFDVGRKQKESI